MENNANEVQNYNYVNQKSENALTIIVKLDKFEFVNEKSEKEPKNDGKLRKLSRKLSHEKINVE